MSTLERAIEIAHEAHVGQYDKAGKDYILHPLRVMERGRTEEEKIVGVLHDVVEDSEWTFEMLEAEGFTPEVIEALRCVTKLSEDEDYDHFINRVLTNPLAMRVKLLDLEDNMDMSRLDECTEGDIQRLQKYQKAYNRIKAESDLHM
jgi:(p)ppGpp synthase/HD superfamily hydrolase